MKLDDYLDDASNNETVLLEEADALPDSSTDALPETSTTSTGTEEEEVSELDTEQQIIDPSKTPMGEITKMAKVSMWKKFKRFLITSVLIAGTITGVIFIMQSNQDIKEMSRAYHAGKNISSISAYDFALQYIRETGDMSIIQTLGIEPEAFNAYTANVIKPIAISDDDSIYVGLSYDEQLALYSTNLGNPEGQIPATITNAFTIKDDKWNILQRKNTIYSKTGVASSENKPNSEGKGEISYDGCWLYALANYFSNYRGVITPIERIVPIYFPSVALVYDVGIGQIYNNGSYFSVGGHGDGQINAIANGLGLDNVCTKSTVYKSVLNPIDKMDANHWYIVYFGEYTETNPGYTANGTYITASCHWVYVTPEVQNGTVVGATFYNWNSQNTPAYFSKSDMGNVKIISIYELNKP